jgi:protein-tyrosine phosphatase
MPWPEMLEARLERLAELATGFGIVAIHFPIGNLHVPLQEDALVTLMGWQARLVAGGGVAVHCWGGVGRSPLVAASLLTLAGVDPEVAWERVQRARGRIVPDTKAQREWVLDLPRRTANGPDGDV